MSSYLYYPGCSMDGSARAYAASLAVVCRPLGLRLEELDDWNCCGATEYLSLSPLKAHALVGRNLALAERQKNGASDLVAPCSACFVNLAKTDHAVRTSPALAERVNTALGAGDLHYTPGSVVVRHLIEVILQDVGVDAGAARVTRPLRGLRVAPYLGCLVTRPDYDHRWRSHEHPREFDRLLAALGADVVDFPLKTDCCGGHMTQIGPATAFGLIHEIVSMAVKREADAIVTVCPMCQMNLDAYQNETNHHFHTNYHMPIIFFTQLMGLAFGVAPEKLGFGTELVDPRPALTKIGVELPPAEPAAPVKKPKKTGLPMPVMPGTKEDES